ncbi:hypothetical protein RHMOL_Rhmol05G0082200 [Rhododendron molle]|uniref:Uncharacterized protein n=1 Tax=Rhododendron molle TaxID=49168 RepID=A0ACC0NN53_RHOML|nr:hypothetical protein RHMOL_Rhmol05G0082200 [Rhododendron molle]
MALNSSPSNQIEAISSLPDQSKLDRFAAVANKAADVAGEAIRKYFCKPFDIIDKEDSTPVTIADRETEEAMVSVIQECFPSHAILGEEGGWRCKEKFADYVWVLDPIDGTASSITENLCLALSSLCFTKENRYTTSPHHFSEDGEVAFARVGFKVKAQLYGCDCYAYALLALGCVDIMMDFGLEKVPVELSLIGKDINFSGILLHIHVQHVLHPKVLLYWQLEIKSFTNKLWIHYSGHRNKLRFLSRSLSLFDSDQITLHRLIASSMSSETEDAVRRRTAVAEYRKKLLQHKELESRVRGVRENLRATKKEYAKTEDDLKSLQSVGQIIGEVLRPLDNERCNYSLIVKASSGPRYVVGCRSKVDKEKLTSGTRVVLDMTTLTIMRALPREVDPVVYNMLHEDPGNISYSAVGGLSDQIRELRESIELPLMNPELFLRVGIKPPKGVLLYGPPGTGKTLLARAIASNIDANFLKVVSSAIIDKYIGESARLIREMFGYARDHQPCIIFMDEIDAIGGRRFSEGTSADREIQRTLMELLNQLDGFDQLGKVKMIMATNRPDVLDPALLRPGRLDRKIEIPLPNEQSRMEILKIHAAGIAKHGDIDYEAVVKLAEGFNGADLRNVCTEAGMAAIRAERDYVIHEDFMKAVRKLTEAKKLESSAHYNTDFGKD